MSTSNTLGLRASSSFNPAVLPLLSTSAQLFYALLETVIFRCFLGAAKTDPVETKRVQHRWWLRFWAPSLALILVIEALNLVSGIYVLRALPRQSQEWKIAAAGLAFAFSHFAYGKKVVSTIDNIISEENERKGTTMHWIREWLRVHTWRTWTTDVPAVACFAWLVFA